MSLLRWFRWVLLILFFGFAQCSGVPNPAAPPGPPAELPSALRFPEEISINVGKLGSESSSAALTVKAQEKTDFALDILAAFITSNISGTFVDLMLASFNELFDALAIPVSPSVKTVIKELRFSSEQFVPTSGNPIEIILPLLVQIAESEANGRFDPEGDVIGTIKIDFSDFDADGDGVKDGCTGCTCPAGCDIGSCPKFISPDKARPICYQIWVDNEGNEIFKRLLAGRFDQLPTPATDSAPEIPGAGTYIQRYSFPTAPQVPPFGIRVFYDQKDLANRFNDFRIRADDPLPSDFISSLLDNVRMTQLQEGADEFTSKKTVKFAQECRPGREEDCAFAQPVGRQVSRYRDSGVFWSASGENPFGDSTSSFTNACVNLDTAQAVDRQNCIDAGIDVEGEAFVDFVEDFDVQYPAGFPALPPF